MKVETVSFKTLLIFLVLVVMMGFILIL